VNQDTLGSIDKCLLRAREILCQKDKHSVCVDNTNMDPKARARWVQLARELNVQVKQKLCVNLFPGACCFCLEIYLLVRKSDSEAKILSVR